MHKISNDSLRVRAKSQKLPLIENGITTSKAEWMFHVCIDNSTIYGYRRKEMVDLLSKDADAYRLLPAYGYQSLMTGLGYVVPLSDIRDLRTWIIPESILGTVAGMPQGDTSELGRVAEKLFKEMCNSDIIEVPLKIRFENSVVDQMLGCDFKVTSWFQVKMDRKIGKTNNIFVQIAERNPEGKH